MEGEQGEGEQGSIRGCLDLALRVPMERGNVCFDPRGRMLRHITSHTLSDTMHHKVNWDLVDRTKQDYWSLEF
jgi:hypothetical protein